MGHGGHQGGIWEDIIFAAIANASFGACVEQIMTVCARNINMKMPFFQCLCSFANIGKICSMHFDVSVCIMFLFPFLSVDFYANSRNQPINRYEFISYLL